MFGMEKVHQQTQDDNFSASPFVCVSKHLYGYIYNIYPVVRKTVIMARNKLAEKRQASKQEKNMDRPKYLVNHLPLPSQMVDDKQP